MKTIKHYTSFTFNHTYNDDIKQFINDHIIKTVNHKSFVKYLDYDCEITFIRTNEKANELIIEYETRYDKDEVTIALRQLQENHNEAILFIINNCVTNYQRQYIWSINKFLMETESDYQLMKLIFVNEDNQKRLFDLVKQNKQIPFLKLSTLQRIQAFADYQTFKQVIDKNGWYGWLTESEIMSLLMNTKTLGFETMDDIINQ